MLCHLRPFTIFMLGDAGFFIFSVPSEPLNEYLLLFRETFVFKITYVYVTDSSCNMR